LIENQRWVKIVFGKERGVSMRRDQTLSIAIISSPNVSQSGDFIYRVRQPGTALGQMNGVQVVACPSISPLCAQLINQADLVIIDMLGEMDFFPLLQARQGPWIYELSDNIFDIQPCNPIREFFSNSINQATILQLLTDSHLVQTTSEHLSQIFSPYAKTIHTIPNQIAQVPDLKEKKGTIVLGWGGSFGHLEDLRAIAPYLCSWLIKHPRVHLHLMGAQSIFDLFHKVPEQQKRYFPTGSLFQYQQFLKGLHIGLAPIEKTGFNLCRSDVKLLEYQAHGVVALCRAIGPYLKSVEHDVNGLLYNTPEELVNILDELRCDPQRIQRLRRNGHSDVKTNRQEHQHAQARLQLYLDLCQSRDYKPRAGSLAWIDPRRFTQHEPGYHELIYTEAEEAIFNGLASELDQGGQAGVHWFEKAIHAQPDYYLPYCYLANALFKVKQAQAALKHLETALQLNPHSYQAQLQMAMVQAAVAGPEEAHTALQKGLRHQPGNARLHLALAVHHGGLGHYTQAIQALKKGLSVSPRLFPAMQELGLLLFKTGDPQSAVDAFASYLKIKPQDAQSRFMLACNLLKLARMNEGIQELKRALKDNPDHQQARALLVQLGLAGKGQNA
jgi:tetratricopeptide (TPR) repeat protein